MINKVLGDRSRQFGAVPASDESWLDADHDQVARAVTKVPDASRYWGLRYIEHALNPLRDTPPGYVEEIITTGHLDERGLVSRMPDNVAGAVVARLP